MRQMPPIKPIAILALLASIALAVICARASAQDLSIQTLSIGNRTGNANTDPVNFPLSTADCEADAEIVIRVSGIPTTGNSSYLDLWKGNDCNLVTNRNNQVGGVQCEPLVDTAGNIGSQNVQVTGSPGSPMELALPVSALIDCATQNEGQGAQNIFILFAPGPRSTAEVTSYGKYPFEVDFTPPPAPTNLSGSNGSSGTGDTAIKIAWDASGSATTLLQHKIYVGETCTPSNSSGDGGVSSTVQPLLDGSIEGGATDASLPDASLDAAVPDASIIDAGGATPDASVGSDAGTNMRTDGLTFVQTAPAAASGATLNGADLDLEYGESRYVYVTAVDRAGNESDPSGGVCITRVQVSGFCDVYGECDDCSVRAMPRKPATFMMLGLALVGLAWRRRK